MLSQRERECPQMLLLKGEGSDCTPTITVNVLAPLRVSVVSGIRLPAQSLKARGCFPRSWPMSRH